MSSSTVSSELSEWIKIRSLQNKKRICDYWLITLILFIARLITSQFNVTSMSEPMCHHSGQEADKAVGLLKTTATPTLNWPQIVCTSILDMEARLVQDGI